MSSFYQQHSGLTEEVERVAVGGADNPNLVAQQGVLFRHCGELIDMLQKTERKPWSPELRQDMQEQRNLANQLVMITLPWREATKLLKILRQQEIHAATMFPGQKGVAELVREVFLSHTSETPSTSAG